MADMHVVDDVTMQDLLRFVKAHHTWVRHNCVMRQKVLEIEVLAQKLHDISKEYAEIVGQAKAIVEKQSRKKGHA